MLRKTRLGFFWENERGEGLTEGNEEVADAQSGDGSVGVRIVAEVGDEGEMREVILGRLGSVFSERTNEVKGLTERDEEIGDA